MPELRNFELIRKEFHDLNIEVTGLRIELQSFKETVEKLFKIVYGNGSDSSLITRLALTTQELTEIKEDLKNIKKDKVTIMTAIISGGLGLLASIILGLLHFLKR